MWPTESIYPVICMVQSQYQGQIELYIYLLYILNVQYSMINVYLFYMDIVDFSIGFIS